MKENINKQQILILRYVKLKHSTLTINAKTRPSPPRQPKRYFQTTVICCDYTWTLTLQVDKLSRLVCIEEL